jgi:hypothetical protein
MPILDRDNLIRTLIRRADGLAEFGGGIVAGLQEDGVRFFAFVRVFRACVSVDTSAGLVNIAHHVVGGNVF